MRPGLRADNPDSKVGDIVKKLKEMWSKAEPEDKAVYEAEAQKDKERYDKVRVQLKYPFPDFHENLLEFNRLGIFMKHL